MASVRSNVPLVLRLVSCSVAAATKAGAIIRNVLQKGDLGVVDKVTTILSNFVQPFTYYILFERTSSACRRCWAK